MKLEALENHRKRLGAAGKRKICKRFSVERMVGAYDEHFKMPIKEKKR